MKKIIFILSTLVFLLWASFVFATPSTIYWTAGTADIQPYKVWHITIDNYFDEYSNFPPNYGLTVGILPFEKFQVEMGIDVLEPCNYPLYLNAKFGSPENSLFSDSPAWSFGMWNIGTKSNVTDYDILQLAFTKTLPNNFGRIHLVCNREKSRGERRRRLGLLFYTEYSDFNGTSLV